MKLTLFTTVLLLVGCAQSHDYYETHGVKNTIIQTKKHGRVGLIEQKAGNCEAYQDKDPVFNHLGMYSTCAEALAALQK